MGIKARSAAHRFALLGALTMIIGLGAASAASATQVPVWTQNGTHTPFGTEVAFSGSSATGMNIQWTQSGLHFWVGCQALSTSGKIEDSAYGKAGTLKPNTPLEAGTFKACGLIEVGDQTANNNTTCSVPKEIPFKYTSGALTNTPYSTGGLKLSGLEIDFQINGCPQHTYDNLTWHFWGNLTGNEGQGAFPGEILFPEGTPIAVNAGGSAASIDFGMRIPDAAETPIKIGEEEVVAPHNPGHHYWYTGGAQRKGEGAQALVAAGSPLAIKGSGNTMSIEGSLSGIKTQVSCNGGTTTGSVENPAGGGDGNASVTLAFTGCTVPVPAGKGCYIEGGGFSTGSLPGALQKAEAFAPLSLKGTGGGELIATIPIRGCSAAVLNNNFPVTGSLLVSPYLNLSAPGSWTVAKSQTESSKLLKFGGNYAAAGGILKAETSGGQAVTWTE
jgi:hypothetical protein